MKKTLVFNRPNTDYDRGDLISMDGYIYKVLDVEDVMVRGTAIGTSVNIETINPKKVSSSDILTIMNDGIKE